MPNQMQLSLVFWQSCIDAQEQLLFTLYWLFHELRYLKSVQRCQHTLKFINLTKVVALFHTLIHNLISFYLRLFVSVNSCCSGSEVFCSSFLPVYCNHRGLASESGNQNYNGQVVTIIPRV